MQSRSDVRILLVEDNEVNQMVTLKQLQQLGYAADLATNGKDALNRVTQTHYDLILMDCQMPVMDGYMATQCIRSQVEADHQPIIIAITANATAQDRQRCLEVGMDDYLSKPLRQADLSQKLTEWEDRLEKVDRNSDDISVNSGELTEPESIQPESIQPESIQPESIQPESSADQPILPETLLNWDYLHRLSRNNLSFEKELLQTFISTLPDHLTKLKTDWAIGDWTALQQEAHYIKGASVSLGIEKMGKSAAEIEQASQARQLEKIQGHLDQLEAHFNQIVEFVHQFCNEGG